MPVHYALFKHWPAVLIDLLHGTIDIYKPNERGSMVIQQMKNAANIALDIPAILKVFNLRKSRPNFHDFNKPFKMQKVLSLEAQKIVL